MMRRRTSCTFSIVLILLGIFTIIEDDFLNLYGIIPGYMLTWVDDYIFGIFLVCLGIFNYIAYKTKNYKHQTISFVMMGGTFFSVGTVYLQRTFLGYPNITWILAYGLFFLIYTSILYKGNRDK